jgi:OFA family oxalate/formate antiporter-like MFS transporter
VFVGWRIVGICFFSCFVSVGLTFYSYGVFFKAIMGDLGGSRLAMSTGLTAMNFAVAVTSPFVGRVLDRGHARSVMCSGALLLAMGFGLGSHVSALWQFHLVFGTLMGAAVCMLGPLTTSALVANWFVLRRGTALAYAATGISAGGIIIPVCINKIIAAHGWRFGFGLCAAFVVLALLPVLYLGVTSRPEASKPRLRGRAGKAGVPKPQGFGTSVRAETVDHLAMIASATRRRPSAVGLVSETPRVGPRRCTIEGRD